MARITVEDCLPVVPNRFVLVNLPAARARNLGRGASSRDSEPNHKSTVKLLKEFASGQVHPHERHEALIGSLMRYRPEDMDPAEKGMTDESAFARMRHEERQPITASRHAASDTAGRSSAAMVQLGLPAADHGDRVPDCACPVLLEPALLGIGAHDIVRAFARIGPINRAPVDARSE